MIRINFQDLTEDQEKAVNGLLAIDMPERIKYNSLVGLPFLRDRIEYLDESHYDKVDKAASSQQPKLMQAYQDYLAGKDELGQESFVLVNLQECKIGIDSRGRPIANATIHLWENEAYMNARSRVETARLKLWGIWYRAVEGVCDTETTSSGRTKTVPAWEFRDGQIVCRRPDTGL